MYLRPYRRDDLEQLFALDCLCFAPPFRFSRGMLRRCAERKGAISMLACDAESNRLLGFVIMHVEQVAGTTAGYVDTLDVSLEARRRGIAAALMSFAEAAAASQGATKMHLHVSAENAAAVALYERRNYKQQQLLPDFYAPTLPAWRYVKILDLEPS